MSMAVCLIGIAWHPLRLILPGIVIAMIAAGMAGPRSRRLAFASVIVAAASFFVGMLIAVVVQHPLW
jgi:Na+/phosphate symporter